MKKLKIQVQMETDDGFWDRRSPLALPIFNEIYQKAWVELKQNEINMNATARTNAQFVNYNNMLFKNKLKWTNKYYEQWNKIVKFGANLKMWDGDRM